MHMIQAQVLHDIIEYIQDKCGVEPELVHIDEDQDNIIHVSLSLLIGRDYPGMKPDEDEQP